MSKDRDKKETLKKAKEKKKQKIQRRNDRFNKMLEKYYDNFSYPPTTQQHLRGILLSYLNNLCTAFPLHSIQLLKKIKQLIHKCSQLRNIDEYMKNLNIVVILIQLSQKNVNFDQQCFKIQKRALGAKLVQFIEDFNYEVINQLYKKYKKDIPKDWPQDDQTTLVVENNNQIGSLNKETLLNMQTVLSASLIQQSERSQKQLKKLSPSQMAALKYFREKQPQELFCDYATYQKCQRNQCNMTHFKKVIRTMTKQTLGNCSNLNTCKQKQCNYIHYEIAENLGKLKLLKSNQPIFPKQWVCCDLRTFDFKILGKFDVIMADPPWDIHMTLPYQTLKDKQMKSLRLQVLQDSGLIFLWVTGRAMEIGRDCLIKWGYKKVQQIVWVKLNPSNSQSIIRAGRTGHWLNHTKQHCLVGIKGDPAINRNSDCDVIVTKVRQTSRKPDQIYSMIQRLKPRGKKIQLFGRPHNTREGWLTLGNQLKGNYIKDKQIRKRFSQAFPQEDISQQRMQKWKSILQSGQHHDQVYNSHIQNAGKRVQFNAQLG